MCGLIAFLKTSDRPLDPRLIEVMTHTMEHRGPDDFGMCFVGKEGPILWRNSSNVPQFAEKGVAMGHRRLSIFDLTEAGRQPFLSPSKRYTMVFNGEIYNYVELRDELIRHGFHFSTNCDTEVLLAAFEKWGTECFNRLNGYWAAVIWDNLTNTLVASRDRLGEKPLHFAQVDGDWIFASEAKALLKHPKIDARPNEELLANFIASGPGYRYRGEETFFSNIYSIEPGTFLMIRDGDVSKTRYWNLMETSFDRRTDDASAVQKFDDLLTDACRLRLRGDMRIGAMLSGGIDSTSVITSIVRLLSSRPADTRMVGDTLEAFTASFPGLENDEIKNVEALCQLIEIHAHKTLPADQDDIEERLTRTIWNMEAPFYSPAFITYDALMKLVRSCDFQVVLDGMGGDELFGGYDWYIPAAIKDSLLGLRVPEAISNLNGTRRKHGKSTLDVIRRTLSLDQSSWDSDLFEPVFKPSASTKVVGANYLDQELKRDVLCSLTPIWCNLNDRISMANSVMSRSPFLDYRLVEFAFTLPNNIKIRDGETKYIIRQAKRGVLPECILNQHKKAYLSGPRNYWLRGPLKNYALSILDAKKSKLRGTILRPDALRDTVDGFFKSKRGDAMLMWRIVSAEAFLRAYA